MDHIIKVHFVNFQLLATETATGKYSSTVLNDPIRGQRPHKGVDQEILMMST